MNQNFRSWIRGWLVVVLLPATIAAQSHFTRGDVSADGSIDITDSTVLLNYLYDDGEEPVCLDACDYNDDGTLSVLDVIMILQGAFNGGNPPAAPYPEFEADPTLDLLSCKPFELCTDVTVDTTWSNDLTYVLASTVFVASGATLTIEPGTTIFCELNGHLIVEPGGVLIADGAEDRPIVFTSGKDPGERKPGDWVGIWLLGNAANNFTGGVGNYFLFDHGGGSSPDNFESSGTLRFVRIEYAGQPLAPCCPPAALFLGSVGEGTVVDHLQISQCRRTALEIHGGLVSIRRVLLTEVGDNGLDASFGWQGTAQFFVVRHRLEAEGRGIELDNENVGFNAVPRTQPLMSNFVLLAIPSNDSGIVVRRGAAGSISGGVVEGYDNAGIDVDDVETTAHSQLCLQGLAFFDVGEVAELDDDEQNLVFTSVDLFASQCGAGNAPSGNFESPESLVASPFDETDPNFLVVDEIDLLPSFNPTLFFPGLEPVNYRGAIDPNGVDWTQTGWTSFATP